MRNFRGNSGFTLIELLIVVAIIGILAAIAIPQFSAYQNSGYKSTVLSDVKNAHKAVLYFFSDSNSGVVCPAVTRTGLGRLSDDYPSALVSNEVTIEVVSGGSDGFSVIGTHDKLAGNLIMDASGIVTSSLE